MTYTHFITVGIDSGISVCGVCGALVPSDMTIRHDAYHAFVNEAVLARGGAA